MTLNGVMALTLRYFAEFGKPAFQHITAFARIELDDRQTDRQTDGRTDDDIRSRSLKVKLSTTMS